MTAHAIPLEDVAPAPVPAQLTFQIDTTGATNTIYVTATASQNDLVLRIGTTATATFTTAPEIPAQLDAPKAKGSLLYLDLSALSLTTAEFAALAPVSTGWTFAKFPDDHAIGMTPDPGMTLEPGSTVDVTLGALACAGAQGASASLSVTVFHVAGITLGALPFPTSFTVALASPPGSGDDLHDDLAITLVTKEVVTSVDGYDPVSNQLVLAFSPGPRGRPVKANAGAQFTLSFVYATDPSGYGALCTPDEVEPPFEVVPGIGAAAWKITPHRAQQSPSWTLQPPVGKHVVSASAPVGILANDLVTRFQPGPTLVLVSYSGFDDYADGVFALPLQKVGHVRIDSLQVRPNPSVLTNGMAEVTVTWKAANAGTMTLAPFDVDVTGKTSHKGQITDSTLVTLTAEGTALSNVGNIALRSTMASVLPVINAFDASPRSLYAGDLPRDVALSWNVDTNGQLELLSSTDGPDPARYSKQGQISKVVAGPQMFTLRPLGQQGTDEQRSIVVSAFAPTARTNPLVADALAAPPHGSFVVAADSRGTVTAVDTMVLAPVSAENVPCGAGPAGMVFSADGTRLYIANSADGTVSVVAVAATGDVPQYTFTAEATIQVGKSPERLALSPDGTYLYVSVDGGTQNGQVVVVDTATGTVLSRLNVGVAPRGLAVLPSGAQIFVANSGSSTVTVIGRSPGGHHAVTDQITGLNTAQDVVVTPDGQLLLVACPSAGAVVAVNAEYPQSPRASLAVGTSPQQLALLPGGGYVAAACSGAGTVALIATGTTPAACRVVDPQLASLAGASAVTVTPDGGLLLAGAGRGGTAIVQLAEYQAATLAPKVGSQPTGVRFASDGRWAVAWHDALQTFSPGSPSTGLSVFDVASGTTTPQLGDVAIVDVALAPVAAKTAFVVAKEQAQVSVVATDTWTAGSTIDLSGETTGMPVALAASSDASTLFVLSSGTAGIDLTVLGAQGGAYAPLGTVRVMGEADSGSTQTLAVAPDGAAAYVTDASASQLFVVARDKTGTYALQGKPVDVGTLPLSSAIAGDGSTLFVASEGITNGTLARVDTATLAVTNVVLPSNAQTQLQGLAVSPDGTRLFATDGVAAGVRVFDADSLRLVQTITLATGARLPNGVAVAPDGARILTANTLSASVGVATQVQADASARSRIRPPLLLAPPRERPIGALGDGDDDDYHGFFIRDYVGQTPTSGTQGTTDCPDIWPSGQKPLPDPSILVSNYQTTDSPNTIFTSGTGVNNWVYVRGENATTDGNMETRVWLYYVNGGGSPQMILWPPSWLNSGIQTQNTPHTWSPVTSKVVGEVDYTTDPFLWSAVPVDGHYCMVAWADNQPLSTPPTDPRAGIGSIGTMDQLAAFIADHPNFGWKNTQAQPTPTGESYEVVLPFLGPKKGGIFRVGLMFNDEVPSDSTVSFAYKLVGPNIPKRKLPLSADVPKTPVNAPGETYMVPLDWTGADSYVTNMVVTIWAPGGVLPQGGNFQIAVGVGTTRLVGLTADPLVTARRLRVYPTHRKEDGYEQEYLALIGDVQINAPGS